MDSIGKWISTIHRYNHIYISRQFETLDIGIGKGQMMFLLFLYKNDGVTQDYISKKLYIDKATVTRAIQKLESEGFVKRTVSPDDRRQNLVYLTKKARKVEKDILNVLRDVNDVMSENFTEQEKDQIICLLKKMVNNMVTEIQEKGVEKSAE
ncbi:MarR family winged helix-turn-helix transcriptional regulator [Bacillus carboniphilus]|uniref:MarR family winged helix-turn-helix transcriptional regulator n=1 Tax=Bacillus carboniphilus TaxID=86663 RepID=A0ABY9JXV8_9BACI|nr:MarR family winged helix-turn-helix transcriptional regulator [Bacillus carboniphilus]WLR42455.1 MarR family winged helix-turn-helix transcriptional regulator [Bacillus carboniphilus]